MSLTSEAHKPSYTRTVVKAQGTGHTQHAFGVVYAGEQRTRCVRDEQNGEQTVEVSVTLFLAAHRFRAITAHPLRFPSLKHT
jgi:hypothetical protein